MEGTSLVAENLSSLKSEFGKVFKKRKLMNNLDNAQVVRWKISDRYKILAWNEAESRET